MVFESYIALVTVVSLIYVAIAKFLQDRMTDKKAMADMQAESKRLNKEFDEAKKRNDKTKMDKVMQEQMDFLPKMNKVMFSQFKPMFVILGLFLIITWAVMQLDPSTKDDIRINMSDDGKGCDLKAGDGIFSACFLLPGNATLGKWQFTGIAYNKDGGEIGRNSTFFVVGPGPVHDNYTDAMKGELVSASTGKSEYNPGEIVKLYASDPNAAGAVADLDNGTVFYVDLPFTIPLVFTNVQRIYQAYWWFIFISLIANIGFAIAMTIINRTKGTAQSGAIKTGGGNP